MGDSDSSYKYMIGDMYMTVPRHSKIHRGPNKTFYFLKDGEQIPVFKVKDDDLRDIDGGKKLKKVRKSTKRRRHTKKRRHTKRRRPTKRRRAGKLS